MKLLARAVIAVAFALALSQAGFAAPKPGRLLMAHYMPWFRADPAAGKWGEHWTMNHFDPNKVVDGRRQIASHFYPLIGPYDSGDPDVAECHALLMKLTGIDGAVIDWYGTDDYYDYAANNANADVFARALRRAGLKYAILYEDTTVQQLILGKRLAPADAVSHGRRTLEYLQKNWFDTPSYATLGGRPLFLVFGGNGGYYQGAQWSEIFSVLAHPPAFFTELGRNPPAMGGFGWPQPSGGTAASFTALDAFYKRAAAWPAFIAPAYPRFDDIYQEAGVHPSWGKIAGQGGKTYVQTLARALESSAQVIQIATFNDWGEGTQIEPSAQLGYRDLEATQRLVKKYLKPNLPYTPADLRLPVELYLLRKADAGDPRMQADLDKAADLLYAGQTAPARALLAKLQARTAR